MRRIIFVTIRRGRAVSVFSRLRNCLGTSLHHIALIQKPRQLRLLKVTIDVKACHYQDMRIRLRS